MPFVLENPYAPGGTPYKAQLHQHSSYTLASGWGGTETPQAIADELAALGYDILALTDYRTATPASEITGNPLLYVVGCEMDSAGSVYLPHHIGYNVDSAQYGLGDSLWVGQLGWTLAQSVAAFKADGDCVSAAHPARPAASGYWNIGELGAQRPRLFEVYNSGLVVDSSVLWDSILAYRRTVGVPWGLGVSDSHVLPVVDDAHTWLYMRDLSLQSFLDSLRSGNCYAAQGDTDGGPTITSIAVSGLSVTIVVPASSNFVWTKTGGAAAQTDNAVLTSTYTVGLADDYVRCTITRVAGGKKMWTQPFFVRWSR